MTLFIAVLASTLVSTAVSANPTYAVVPGQSNLTYELTHKLKKVHGTSKQLTGKARLLTAQQKLQVAMRVPVASFDSNNGNRDTHMQEVTDAARFPAVEFKGAADKVEMPSSFPATLQVSLGGVIKFHGVEQNVTVPLKVTFTSATHATADTSFPVSLVAFQIERPALMFVPVDDAVVLNGHFVLEAEP